MVYEKCQIIFTSVLYKHIIEVENKNVGLNVGGTKIPLPPPNKKVPPPPLPTPVSDQGRSKREDRVDNVQGPRKSRGPQTKMNPLVWGPITVPCPWATEGVATLVIQTRLYNKVGSCVFINANRNFYTFV